MNVESLEPGKRYTFHTKPWEAPTGEAIPGCAKTRMFVGLCEVGAVALPKEPFVEVERDDGRRHLIAVQTIRLIESA